MELTPENKVIAKFIAELRNEKIMLHLAQLYGAETRALKQ